MKYLFFDLDGTIENNKEGIVKSVYYALNSLDIEESEPEKLERFIGPPLADSFRDYYSLNDTGVRKAIEKYRERYSAKGVYECSLYGGVKELLSALKDEGFVLCIATSKPQGFTEIILKNLEVSDFFSHIQGASMDNSLVRKGDIIGALLARLPAEAKSEALMIGDREHDIFGAQENGLKSMGVRWGFAEDGELENAGADYIADDMTAALEIIRGLKS